MNALFEKLFRLNDHQTTVGKESLAGVISFLSIVYIIAVNSTILSDAGIPLEAGIFATVASAFVGCVIMAFWANAPLILVPGMGINALFTYTMVQSMGLSWQEGLLAVVISGFLFIALAFSRLSAKIVSSIPHSLKEAITVGVGLFLTFIGLQKGKLVVPSENTFVALGDLSDPFVISTLLTLIITIVLFIRNVKGNFLLSMIAGSVLAFLLGVRSGAEKGQSAGSVNDFFSSFGTLSFGAIGDVAFWAAVFSLTMVLIFENIGLLHGQLGMMNQDGKFPRAFQATAASALLSGVFGTSPTVSSVEGASGIAAGGRTGLTSLITGVLFLSSLLFIPFIKLVPDSAIAPILIVIGALMIQNIKNINLQDLTEGFPAFLIIALIPLTYSIADGIAFGFIAYPLLKLFLGKMREVSMFMYVSALLFFLNFVLHYIA
ncbi:NCS2 family permease [Priestia sp. YIM B13446]|uniref:NCS2 family permease n=1 Tax=Priestia TaxID=2800373 RepID=UPI00048BD981|nr:NCS2 family permease [Priestia megaterium]KWU58096.1 permease [Priestia megaterium]MCM3151031.1 NCS2 family permease [Priestia megaterium]MCP1450639.1 AGZA family xanthine/uracil permease-like MFS transporter [Priestia megaterium]MCU7740003.1 NCS2 family permease [Priestia megaterium]MCU7745378.1 NCS2 family permease [Priestia megaterium]